MNSKRELPPSAHALPGAVFILPVFFASLMSMSAVPPPTFWTGPSTNYTQTPVPVFPTPGGQDVLVAGAVSLDRGTRDRMYNGIMEGSHSANVSPADTEWATATPTVTNDLTTAASLAYANFDGWVGAHAGPATVQSFIVNRAAVVHLVSENIYIAIKFSAWTEGGGGFSYTRSTPAVVAPSPTVSITNPVGGAVFSAPANVKIGAAASVSSGTVTNVAFFNGVSPLGSAQSAPFNITAGNLTAGAYALKAVATAAGVSSTSAVVNISVVVPSAVSNTAPAVTNGQFSFNYNANPGLTYVVQRSPDLTNWSPVITNTPNSSPVHVTDGFIATSNRFYRVGRLPNP